MGNSLAGEKDGALGTRLVLEDKLGGVPVAVESKPGTMADSPEQGFPAKLVESIGSIYQESTMKVFGVQILSVNGGALRAPLLIREWGCGSGPDRGTSWVPLPSFSNNIGGALNAGSEASTEIEVATCLSSMVA